MVEKVYPDPISAFKGINRILLFEEELIEEFGLSQSAQVQLYNLWVRIERGFFPEDFNFTELANYRASKGTSLINNYIDMEYLEEVLALVYHKELKKVRNYNVSFHFANMHDGGKGCLLTCTFTRRYMDEYPTLIATVRASESYKRLLFDFLLLVRMGQKAYGETPFSIEVFFPYIWNTPDWLSMFLAWDKFSLKKAKKAKNGAFAYKVYKKYVDLLNTTEEEMNNFRYHALKRSWKVIHGKLASPPYLSSNFNL